MNIKNKRDGKNLSILLLFSLIFIFSLGLVSPQAWDFEDSHYENEMLLTQGSEPESMFFNNDGTILYENNYPDGEIFQYSCSEAWEIESCSYSGVSQTLDANSGEIEFSDDGKNLYTIDNDEVIQYSLSTPWDISSFTEEGRLTLGFTDRRMKFGNSGNSLYIIKSVSNDLETILQFNCSDAWNVTTCVDSGLSLTSIDSVMNDLFFNDNGTFMYEVGAMDAKVYQYECSTPWKIDTCSYLGKNVSTQSAGLGLNGIFISSDGAKMYEVGQDDSGEGADAVYQYILDFPETYVIGPKEGTSGAPTNLDIMVRVEDPQGDIVNVSFYDASDDSLIGQKKNVESGSEILIDWNSLSWDTSYQWYFEINDGENVTNSGVYNFSTLENLSSCMNLTVPGEYILQGDVLTSLENCFVIEKDDIVFNGNGHSLVTSNYGGDGIYAERQRGVVVKNFANISGFSDGIFFRKGIRNSVINSTTTFNEFNGVVFVETTKSSIIGSVAHSNKNGFVFDYGEGQHSIINSSSYLNSGFGAHVLSLETPAGSVSFENYNRFENNLIENNSRTGIYLGDTDYNTFDNNSVLSNEKGIELYSSSDNSVFYNNTVSFNDAGVDIQDSQNNGFENNFFNNTDNVDFSSSPENVWNKSLGNLWATPLGDGFSENCIDLDSNGVCDRSYDVQNDDRDCSSGNCDYAPLSMHKGEPSDYTVLSDCGEISSPGKYVLFADIHDVSRDCFLITSDNVTLDAEGYEIVGDGNTSGIGVRLSAVENVTVKNFREISGFKEGVIFDGVQNSMLENVVVKNNTGSGLYVSSSFSNIIKDNSVQGSSGYGLYLTLGSGNVFSGNVFNNSNNSYLYSTMNSFNDSFEGNTWTNPSGSGFSDTCNDSDANAFCEGVYDVENDAEGCASSNCDKKAHSTKIKKLYSCGEITEPGNYLLAESLNQTSGKCFEISANDVALNGNGKTVVGDGADYFVYMKGISNVAVRNFLNVTGFKDFAYLYSVNNANITDNGVYHPSSSPLRAASYTRNVDGFRFDNNLVVGYPDGHFISDTSNVEIVNNTFINSSGGTAVHLEDDRSYIVSNVSVIDNILRGGGTGIMVNGENVVVQNNLIENFGVGMGGSTTYDVVNATIINNTIKSNSRGFDFDYFDVVSIINNTIINNDVGFTFSSSEGNAIYGNYIANTDEFEYDYDLGDNNWTGPSFGNYWARSSGKGFSQYCFDVDSDGICDSEYDVKEEAIGCSSGHCDHMPLSTEIGRETAAYPESPYNGEETVFTSPILNISVFDSDKDSLDIRFYDASDGSLIGQDLNVASDSNAEVHWEGLELDTVYEWYAVLDDGSDTYRTPTWQFRTYTKNLTKCQDINVAGRYKLTSDIYTDTSCLRIYASDVIIDGDGHSLVGDFEYDEGIFIAESASKVNNVTVKNFRNITGFGDGIYFKSSDPDYNEISNINILNNSFYESSLHGSGVLLSGSSSYPIKEGVIAGNYFEGHDTGLDLHTVENFEIYSNEFFANEEAMYLYPSHSEIFDNTFESNNFSFYVDINGDGYGENSLVYGNIFMDNITLGGFTYSTFIFPENISWNFSGIGNYWGNMNESGYSNDCLDENEDSFCDNGYDIDVYDSSDSTMKSTGDVDAYPISNLSGNVLAEEMAKNESNITTTTNESNITTTTTPTTTTNGGGGEPPFWKGTYVLNDKQMEEEFNSEKGFTRALEVKNRMRIKVTGGGGTGASEEHHVGVANLSEEDKTAIINVSSDPQQAEMSVGDIEEFDVTNDSYYDISVELLGIEDGKANITVKSIYEEITEEVEGGVDDTEEDTSEDRGDEQLSDTVEEEKSYWYFWVLGTVLAGLIVWFIYKNPFKNK